VRVVGGSNPLVPTISILAVKLILLTNDDGLEAEGIKTLEAALVDLAHIIVVAPDQERSAVSHGLTLRTPLSHKEIRSEHYVLNGTPADCVIFALRHLFVRFPDLVISGINHGANLGDDIMYSGTVAAAREASAHGIPSMAVSQAYTEKPIRFKEGAEYTRGLVAALLANGIAGEICLNVNFPPVRRIKGMKITRQGCSEHTPHFNALDFKGDLDGLPFSPVQNQKTEFVSDRQAIMENYVSITPLQRDQTDYTAAQSLMREADTFFRIKGR
jgi:5'-nucleotidase